MIRFLLSLCKGFIHFLTQVVRRATAVMKSPFFYFTSSRVERTTLTEKPTI